MEIHFGQIYITPGATFPFSWQFQGRISEELTALVSPSPKFKEKYGSEFNLIFNISAKKQIQENEIRGPTVFKKDKDVEYSIFLPFDVIKQNSDVLRTALQYLLRGVCDVFALLGIDATKVVQKEEAIIENICSDPTMFEREESDEGE